MEEEINGGQRYRQGGVDLCRVYMTSCDSGITSIKTIAKVALRSLTIYVKNIPTVVYFEIAFAGRKLREVSRAASFIGLGSSTYPLFLMPSRGQLCGNRHINHKTEQRVDNLSSCKHGCLTGVIICRGNLSYVCSNDLKSTQAVNNSKQLARREPSWFRSTSTWLFWFQLAMVPA